MGAEAIREGQGWLVALTGIITVFVALVVITLIISALPGILRVLARFYPEQEDAPSPAKKSSDTAQVAAAIAVAYHQKNS
ncbi:oxaloacetate decarboxylase, gamma subunit [Chitinivibrio alkaliphilus ACht1]|uniref:Oxaloacetate decarboxylase, gamma subunit n=2 Tax=Chitinivibrio TaxID=1505231 RepID=U7D368_9BACT|nr:oxaloacetate decarboxylase, gamma subunit [Chitinivibrio alkaliphilus ACht1]